MGTRRLTVLVTSSMPHTSLVSSLHTSLQSLPLGLSAAAALGASAAALAGVVEILMTVAVWTQQTAYTQQGVASVMVRVDA